MEATLSKVNQLLATYIDTEMVWKFIKEHKVALLATSPVILYGIWFLKRPRNLPPGPYGYPMIGSMPAMVGNLSANLSDLGKKYGDVYTLWLGGDNYLVLLNSYDVIKEVFVTRATEFLERKPMYMLETMMIKDTLGTVAYHDPIYKTSRTISSQGLRTVIGNKLDAIFEQEMLKFGEYIDEMNSCSNVDISIPTSKVAANVALGIFFNKTYDFSDEELISFKETLNEWYGLFMELFVLDLAPTFLGMLMHSKINKSRKLTQKMLEYIKARMAEHQYYEGDETYSLLDAYIRTEEKHNFSDDQIAGTFSLLLPDSVRAVNMLCQWTIIYLLNNPEYQDKLRKEIQKVKGDSMISVKDRPNMPLVDAFVMEVLRVVNFAAIGTPSLPAKATTLRGYSIHANIAVWAHFGAVHKDPRYFPQPELFQPERFIKDGKIGNTEGFMPFGIGRRSCIGETLTRTEMFIFLANMVQLYKIMPGEEGLPSLKKDPKCLEMVTQKFTVNLQKRKE